MMGWTCPRCQRCSVTVCPECLPTSGCLCPVLNGVKQHGLYCGWAYVGQNVCSGCGKMPCDGSQSSCPLPSRPETFSRG